MIYGTGIDIVKTDRIREAVERGGNKFLSRVFTEAEIAYAYKKKDPALSLSVRFAAKEAFIKALSHEQNVPLIDIEVCSADNGRPVLQLHGRTGEFIKQKDIRTIHLSLSHEKDYGVACVVIEGIR
ncbi:MAG: holo-ACP synthase [Nitrospirae bacterium]|nr:holo-ACP synthase [Nitrospirota bacterium]